MTRTEAATLRLNVEEAGAVLSALLYFVDTFVAEDDPFPEESARAIAVVERVRDRLRVSVDRHGYSTAFLERSDRLGDGL